jgi:putative DNA primase/helicase
VSDQGGGYRYVAEWEAWISWDGRKWDRVGAQERLHQGIILAMQRAFATAQGRFRELDAKLVNLAKQQKKDEDLEAEIKAVTRLLKWHEQSLNWPRISACEHVLRTPLAIRLDQVERDPWRLNLANGTLDLRTAELHPHDRADMITQACPVSWDPTATSPAWDAFVSYAMGGDHELVEYLQRLVGYAITGLTSEHILAFFHGGGRNGKSTFLQVIRTMLGEYACAAPRDLLFEDRGHPRHPAELARLYGKRFAVCAEIGEHTTLDEAKVKDLTGGDTVSVRRMREDYWDLVPTHTLFIAGNHKPNIKGDDLGIWRRIRLIPWDVTVLEADVDRDLPQKLASELPGILRWCVDGCLSWREDGLREPSSVVGATSAYRKESDALGAFLAQHCVFEPGGRVTRAGLREKYEEACKEDGAHPVGPKKLAQRIQERGCRSCQVREGTRVKDGWAGLRLKSDYERQCESEPDSGNEVS